MVDERAKFWHRQRVESLPSAWLGKTTEKRELRVLSHERELSLDRELSHEREQNLERES